MPRSTRNQPSEDHPLVERLADRFLGNGGARRAARISAWSFLVGGIALGLGFGIPELLEQRARDLAGTSGRLEMGNTPDWFERSPKLAGQLEQLIFDHMGGDPTDRDGLVRAHAALERSGWFTEVIRLHRKADGTIVVDGTLAQPFAVVRWGNFDHLVDIDGHLLDWPYPAGTASPLLPVLLGARTPPPVDETGHHAFGTRWAEAREIEAGIVLARAMHDRPWRREITAIDVSTYLQDRCLRLETNEGPSFKWGQSPDEMSASEISTEDKLRTLDSFHEFYGQLGSLPRNTIDIRHDISTQTRLASE
jgi:hypothetical protein